MGTNPYLKKCFCWGEACAWYLLSTCQSLFCRDFYFFFCCGVENTAGWTEKASHALEELLRHSGGVENFKMATDGCVVGRGFGEGRCAVLLAADKTNHLSITGWLALYTPPPHTTALPPLCLAGVQKCLRCYHGYQTVAGWGGWSRHAEGVVHTEKLCSTLPLYVCSVGWL